MDVPRRLPAPARRWSRSRPSASTYIDIYFRTGLYKSDLPDRHRHGGRRGRRGGRPRGDAAFAAGDRVAYCHGPRFLRRVRRRPRLASWSRCRTGSALETAAAALLQGMTAHYLTHSTFPLKPGDTALVHAAAGGAGLLIVQMAKMLGARVIGTISTEAKAATGPRGRRRRGHPLHRRRISRPRSKRLTGGRGVDVVYDSVGAATFLKSLNSLRPRGMMVSFGNASGPVARGRAAAAEPEGLALPHASHAGQLHCHSRGAAVARRRRSELDRLRPAEDPHPPDLPARGGGRRPIATSRAAPLPESSCSSRDAGRTFPAPPPRGLRRSPSDKLDGAAGLLAGQHPLSHRFHGQQRACCCSCRSRPCSSPTRATGFRPPARRTAKCASNGDRCFLAAAKWIRGKRHAPPGLREGPSVARVVPGPGRAPARRSRRLVPVAGLVETLPHGQVARGDRR